MFGNEQAEQLGELSNRRDSNNAIRNAKRGETDAACLLCYGAHHGEYCQPCWEKCFECHLPVQAKADHAENCGAKDWFVSEKYVDAYVKIPAVRATFSFTKPISYLLYGKFVEAKPGMELFSDMADVLFEFESKTKVVLKTTGFTRIRLPVVIQDKNIFTERIVFMTSHDRTIVAANSSRVVNDTNVLAEYEHNTPIVLLLETCTKLAVDVFSGGKIHKYEVEVAADGKKFQIPTDLSVKSKNVTPKMFDAYFPSKKMTRL